MSCFKKRLSLSAALLAGALLLTACGGAPASSASSVPASSVASSEAAEQPEEPAMKYTQTPTVPTETYKEEADFADFLSKAEPGLVIPGLAENLIPQGMDQCDETGILYISGYYTTDGKSSAILAVDTATGELTAEYILLNAGGTPLTAMWAAWLSVKTPSTSRARSKTACTPSARFPSKTCPPRAATR